MWLALRSFACLLSISNYDVILADIVEENKICLLCWWMRCHVEHCLCLRFVDQECNIREEFISFMKLERVHAVDTASAILLCIENLSGKSRLKLSVARAMMGHQG